ncbi:MAG TPA: hypothetical protein VL172_10320 [Kofleriaceae bacterium]|nr:hypothetical protein [Kofleriaceae bacterium]
MNPSSLLGDVLDELLAACAAPELADDLIDARTAWEERRGKIRQDEELWEAWSQAFLDWYVVERPRPDIPPVVVALRRSGDPVQAAVLRALISSQRSVFEVTAMRPGAVELTDLIGGGQFLVHEKRALHGVSPGDIAELRLVGFGGEVLFGRTFIYHPTGTRDAIVGHARRMLGAGASRDEIMDMLAGLRVRCERYRHVSPPRVYEQGGERRPTTEPVKR